MLDGRFAMVGRERHNLTLHGEVPLAGRCRAGYGEYHDGEQENDKRPHTHSLMSL